MSAIKVGSKAPPFELPGAIIVGISADTLKAQEKSMYGKKYKGLERSRFLIDAEGVLRAEWRKVKVAAHADAVLAALKAL